MFELGMIILVKWVFSGVFLWVWSKTPPVFWQNLWCLFLQKVLLEVSCFAMFTGSFCVFRLAVWLFVSVWSDTKNFLGCFDSYGASAAEFFGSGGARFFCWLQEGQAFFGAVNFSDALDKLAGCTVSFLRIQLYNLLPHPWHHKTALKYPSNFFSPFGGCGTCLVPNF